MHSAGKEKAYKPNPKAVSGNDGYICTTLAVEGLRDGADERLLIHSDCFGRSAVERRAGSGGEGALLNGAAGVD